MSRVPRKKKKQFKNVYGDDWRFAWECRHFKVRVFEGLKPITQSLIHAQKTINESFIDFSNNLNASMNEDNL